MTEEFRAAADLEAETPSTVGRPLGARAQIEAELRALLSEYGTTISNADLLTAQEYTEMVIQAREIEDRIVACALGWWQSAVDVGIQALKDACSRPD